MRIKPAGAPSTYLYTGNQALDTQLPAIVFIHGAQNDHSVWAQQSRYFAHHGFRVLALDLPGHGASEGDALTTIDDLADWVAALLDELKIEQATLVGHSMGSLIALACSHRHPSKVSGLALVGSAFPMQVSEQLLTAAANDESAAIDMICNWSHSGLTFVPGSPGFSPFMMSKRLMQRQRPGVLLTDFNACNDWQGGLEAAAACRCPVAIVSGANDMMTPPRAIEKIRLALAESAAERELPAPQMTVLPDCGHSIMMERPTELLECLNRFVARLNRSNSS
ncbi:MAG: alpha/beta fold hydrolase [Burkholderiaceae bacterium]